MLEVAKGSSIIFSLEARPKDGGAAFDPGLVSSMAGAMRRATMGRDGEYVANPDAPSIAFAVSFTAATLTVGPLWGFTLAPAESANVPAGTYLFSAVCTLTSGQVSEIGSQPLVVRNSVR